jgi:hypothetical protein
MPRKYDPAYYQKNRDRIRARAAEYYRKKRDDMIAAGVIPDRKVGRPKKTPAVDIPDLQPTSPQPPARGTKAMVQPHQLKIGDIIELKGFSQAIE